MYVDEKKTTFSLIMPKSNQSLKLRHWNSWLLLKETTERLVRSRWLANVTFIHEIERYSAEKKRAYEGIIWIQAPIHTQSIHTWIEQKIWNIENQQRTFNMVGDVSRLNFRCVLTEMLAALVFFSMVAWMVHKINCIQWRNKWKTSLSFMNWICIAATVAAATESFCYIGFQFVQYSFFLPSIFQFTFDWILQ